VTLALDLLGASAPNFGITLLSRDADVATFDVPAAGPSGRTRVFRITVSGAAASSAREVADALPDFCPERHINRDGSFCLGWGHDAAPQVMDAESAEAWWGLVLEFLRLQMRAERARRWTGPQWAHGSAAVHQAAAEKGAAALGHDVLDDLRQRRIRVSSARSRGVSGAAMLRVTRRGELWFSVWVDKQRVVNKQQPCVCDKGSIRRHRRLRSCGDHAQQAYVLAASLLLWDQAEKRFWEACKDAQCCGTMADCPLRAPPTN
jgi:hypothetical protein